MKNNDMHVLPSTKIIDINKIIFVDNLQHNNDCYKFTIKYSDCRIIELIYYDEKQAKTDRDFILRKIRSFNKYIE